MKYNDPVALGPFDTCLHHNILIVLEMKERIKEHLEFFCFPSLRLLIGYKTHHSNQSHVKSYQGAVWFGHTRLFSRALHRCALCFYLVPCDAVSLLIFELAVVIVLIHKLKHSIQVEKPL